MTTFIETLANLDIYDIWRINHPKSRDYTWSGQTPFTARTIDYIFCDSVSLTKITATSRESPCKQETNKHTDNPSETPLDTKSRLVY